MPNHSFGDSTQLSVSDGISEENSYIKFNVRDLTGPIESATLRLFAGRSSPDGGQVHAKLVRPPRLRMKRHEGPVREAF